MATNTPGAPMGRGLFALRSQAGLTLVEVMVAMTLLLVGLVGTIKLIDVGSASQGDARAREGATNLARELLEDAHDTAYKQIGASGWFTPVMQNLDPGAPHTVTTPSGNSVQTTVTRRSVAYTAKVSWCSVDDSKDGYGTHSVSITWCSDSGTTGLTDPQPEDFKRVTATITYSVNGNSKTVTQTVTFSATGGIVAQTVSSLCPKTPPLSTPACTPPYTITDSTQTDQTFTAAANGAADMKFSVNGVEVTSGVTNNNDGTWDFDWAVAAVVDGTYTIGATAVDALGNRSQTKTIQVRVARGAPLTAQNVTGGYNYVNPTGVGNGGQLVVELQWDSNPEGSVTGYEVLRGVTTVCGGQNNLANSCIDTSPPTSGTTAYTVKTWYQDANNNAQSVTTPYSVTAPPVIPTQYWWQNAQTISQTNCAAPVTSGGRRDLVSSYSPGSLATWTNAANGNTIVGCVAPFTSTVSMNGGFNNITFSGYFKNTNSSPCNLQVELYLNGSLMLIGNGYFFSPSNLVIPANTTAFTQISENLTSYSTTFVSGDQLSVSIIGFNTNGGGVKCTNTTMNYNNSTNPLTITLPLTSAEPVGPNKPTGLAVTANADGTRTLTWTAPTSSSIIPAPDFYRIYRDGTATSNRVDTTDAINTTVATASSAGATTLTVASATGYAAGQTVLVGTGSTQDAMTISSVSGNTLTFTAGMTYAHSATPPNPDPVVMRAVSWTDLNAGGTSHTYRVTSVSPKLAESSFAGPVTG